MSVSARTDERVVAWERGTLRPALVSAALFAIAIFAPPLRLPVLSVFAVLAPYPLALARLRSGSMGGIWAVLVAALLITCVCPARVTLLYLVLIGIPGLLVGESLARGRGLLSGCKWAFAWLAATLSAVLLAARALLARPTLAFLALLDEMRTTDAFERLRAQGLPLEQIEALRAASGVMRDVVAVIYPAIYLVLAGLAVAVNAWLLRRYLVRNDPAWLEDGEFERLRWPMSITVLFVLFAFGLAWPALRDTAANVLVLVGFLFLLQGIAVAAFVGRRLLPPAVPWVLALMLAWAHVLVPLVALALLGLFDYWLDARRWAEAKAAGDD